jgi:hypothetical protein
LGKLAHTCATQRKQPRKPIAGRLGRLVRFVGQGQEAGNLIVDVAISVTQEPPRCPRRGSLEFFHQRSPTGGIRDDALGGQQASRKSAEALLHASPAAILLVAYQEG